jgi:hypothetical protein
MNQPFEIGDSKTSLRHCVIIDAGRFAGVGVGLPEDLAARPQENADLFERRLSRLEDALGFDAICDR